MSKTDSCKDCKCKDVEARLAALENRPVMDKKFLMFKQEVRAMELLVSQRVQDVDNHLLEARKIRVEIVEALAAFQKLLENQHIQRLINSGVF